jgi:hypothetical protein
VVRVFGERWSYRVSRGAEDVKGVGEGEGVSEEEERKRRRRRRTREKERIWRARGWG